MPISLIFLIVLIAALAMVVGYRRVVAGRVDEFVHLADDSGTTVTKQENVGKTLAKLDRVITILIVVTVLYALAVAGVTGYQAFNAA